MLYYTLLFCTLYSVLYFIVLVCALLFFTQLLFYCISLFLSVLHCTQLYSFGFNFTLLDCVRLYSNVFCHFFCALKEEKKEVYCQVKIPEIR